MLTSSVSNESLFSRIQKLVATERRIGVEILECLFEIEKRKAYSALKYDGLFSYCVKGLGFTDSQAYQRIQAMRALKEMPELKPKIESGVLSVSSVSKVQTHLRNQKKSGKKVPVADKVSLFCMMENKTSREVDTKLAELNGVKARRKIVIELDEELEILWEKAKNLSAHRTRADEKAVFKLLLEDWVRKNDPCLGSESKNASVSASVSATRRRTVPLLKKSEPFVREDSEPSHHERQILVNFAPNQSRYVPVKLKRQIWKRDGGKCTNCGSTHALEVDHIQPFGKNGETNASNLRILCRSCNRHAAIGSYGHEKMASFSCIGRSKNLGALPGRLLNSQNPVPVAPSIVRDSDPREESYC